MTDEKRWQIRRRFAIFAFVELVTSPFWAGYVIENLKTPEEFLTGVMWALFAIIGGYIGTVTIDDNWKR